MTGVPDAERGSVVPLILGFLLVCLLIVAGSVALGDAFTKQRYLQSACDGAAIAAANSADQTPLHSSGVSGDDLPLAQVQQATDDYLGRVENRDIRAQSVVQDGTTVVTTCRWHTHIAFGTMFGRGGGVDQTADATARSPLGQ